MDKELEEIRIEREVLSKREKVLKERESTIYSHNRDASLIAVDRVLTAKDIKPEEINYVLGQSEGYVTGFRAAINTVIDALSNVYRDIHMTEDELYMLTSLGAERERAWLKDYKQKQVVEKAGWKFDFSLRCPVWVKEVKEDDNPFV